MNRASFAGSGRWVVKIGSALLTAGGAGLDTQAIAAWVAQLAALRAQGRQVVVVSSGAVAEGMRRLGWQARPDAIHDLQAAAAVGQMGLVQAWESCFQAHGVHTAQVLLTHEDLADRRRYLNARSALRTLLDLGVVPIINENDTVACDELRFGDNDTLGGLVANLIEAKLLVLLTDRDAMYEADPALDPQAGRLATAHAADPALDAMAGTGGRLGRGGMQTKLRAARLAARSGAATWIVGGSIEEVLVKLAAGADIGTLLLPEQEPLQARKLWLAGNLHVRGKLVIDAGAEHVLRQAGRSLLAVGVTTVEGDFRRGDLVAIAGADGREIARGLCNYSADETRRIKGLASSRFAEVLGYVDEEELIHRDNLVLL
ncbi:MAG: glutamate 5-kinase [Pseudomonadota bacterium]